MSAEFPYMKYVVKKIMYNKTTAEYKQWAAHRKRHFMELRPVMRITLTPKKESYDEPDRAFILRIEIFDDPDAITQEQRMRIAEDICALMGKKLTEQNPEV